MKSEEDVFDKIMGLRIFHFFLPFYKKYKEGLLYLLFGGLTFFIAVFVFAVADKVFLINPLIANIVSWICGVTFSFFTTRKWVFKSDVTGMSNTINQMTGFFGARLSTLLLQELLLFFLIEICSTNGIVAKVITEFINIVLNYLVSKFIIFKRKDNA